jgi:hypothetical protein
MATKLTERRNLIELKGIFFYLSIKYNEQDRFYSLFEVNYMYV